VNIIKIDIGVEDLITKTMTTMGGYGIRKLVIPELYGISNNWSRFTCPK
jgi:hypothetical protein